MSIVSPLIVDWIQNKLPWRFTFQPVTQSFDLAPGVRLQIPDPQYIFQAAEGTLVSMTTAFSSPYGGMSMESSPNLDFRSDNTILNSLTVGNTGPNNMTFARVPPDTLPGIYILNSYKEWPWLENCRLFLLNTSSKSIRCLGYGYTMAYLTGSRTNLEKKVVN